MEKAGNRNESQEEGGQTLRRNTESSTILIRPDSVPFPLENKVNVKRSIYSCHPGVGEESQRPLGHR